MTHLYLKQVIFFIQRHSNIGRFLGKRMAPIFKASGQSLVTSQFSQTIEK